VSRIIPSGSAVQGNLRIKFDGVAVVVFALGQGLFCFFAAGDIDYRDGDADDFVDFVAGRLIGDEEGACYSRSSGIRIVKLDAALRFAVEGTEEIWLAKSELFGEDFRDVTSKVRGDGEVVDLGETFVDADVAEVAIKITKADGDAVVDGIELGEALGGQGFEAKRKVGVGCGGARLYGDERSGVHSLGESSGELLGRYGTSIEPALADVAAEPEEHIGDGLTFDAFGDGGKTEAVAEANDGGGDLAAFTSMSHGADEAGVDLKLVEGQKLEVAEAGVAGAEVVECEA